MNTHTEAVFVVMYSKAPFRTLHAAASRLIFYHYYSLHSMYVQATDQLNACEEECKKAIKTIVKEMKEKGIDKWTDTDFPPVPDCLYLDPTTPSESMFA